MTAGCFGTAINAKNKNEEKMLLENRFIHIGGNLYSRSFKSEEERKNFDEKFAKIK